ncbi:TonB-dependent receptor [Flavisolibacter sp. BT320]|nr:TonB-dependent receptor [Flavisolibacter longurius]
MLRRILFMLTINLLIVQYSQAQVTTSSITGTVKSGTNEPLAGATVTATYQPTGTVYTTTSTQNGQFNIQNMQVGGPYTITVTFVGQQPSTFRDVFLRLGEPFVLDVNLSGREAALSEVVVSATGRNSILNAKRTGAITNINTRQLSTLPTITRSLNDFVRVTPQASSTSTGAIGGGNYRQNYITVDGADFNNTFGIGGNLPANGSPISLDAIGEISINVTPYDVKQSGFVGSAINAVTRAGTNSVSASAYTFWRNQNQQGNKVGNNTPFARQNLQENTYGFRVGGPIIKNKLFFFINAEKGDRTQPGQTRVAATPTAPFGSSPDVSRPTAEFLNTVRSYLKNTYNYETGNYQGYDNVSDNTRFVARIDWNIARNHRFNIRYSQVESKSPSFVSTSRSPLSGYGSGNGRQGNNHLWFENTNYFQESNFYSLAAELNSTFGKFANTFRGTFTHQNDPRSSNSTVFPLVDILDGSNAAAPGSVLTTFGYEPFTYGNLRDVRTTSFVDYVTFQTGKHNWTVGGQFDISATKNGFQRFGTSYYTFRSWDDFVNGEKPVDFAVTYPLNANLEQAFPRFKFAQFALYAQDEIAMSDKLRLTLGLRAELPSYLDIPEIQTHPLVQNLNFENGLKLNTGSLPKNRVMWSPRVGFNYDIKGDRSLQLRGGTGIFTGRVPTVWIVAQSGDAGMLQFTQTYATPNADRNNPAAFVTPGPFNPNPFYYVPGQEGNPGQSFPKAGTAIPSTISAIDPDFKFPQVWKSSIALDARLPWGMVGTIEGIYNKDINVAFGKNPNLVAPQPLNIAGYPDNRVIYPVAESDRYLNPITRAGQPVATGAANGTRFDPAYLTNGSKGYYWSLTARLDKQFAGGFSGTLAYTRSQAKNLYDGSGDQLLNTWSLTQIINNPNNPPLSYANYIVPDRIVAALTYRKEYLKHLATQISIFYEGSIQGRFSYTYSSDFNRDGQTNDLIYVPKDASEIQFADQSYGSGSSAVTYTARQQSDLFFRFIEQDPYLSSRRGQYAERNGAKLPWRNQFDVKFAQDIFTNVLGKRNTIQFTVDIFNFANLLNSNWGVFDQINAAGILVPRNTTPSSNSTTANLTVNGVATPVLPYTPGGNTKPYFSLANDRNQPATVSYRQNNTLTSTYYMQFGLRYIFN